MRLGIKLPLLVVVTVLLGTTIAGLIVEQTATRSLRTQVLESARDSLADYGTSVTEYLNQATSLLALTAADPRLLTSGPEGPQIDAAAVTRAARDLLAAGPVFDQVMALDVRDRLVLGRTSGGETTLLPGQDLTYLNWPSQALHTTGPVVGDLQVSPLTARPTVVVAVALRGSNGKADGVLAGGLSLAALSRLGVPARARRGQLYGFLTDRQGLVIAHQRVADYVRRQTDFSKDPPVMAASTGQTAAGEWRNPLDHHLKLGAYTRLPAAGWVAVESSNAASALAPAAALTRTIVTIQLVGGLLLALFVAVVIRRQIRPLTGLATAADRVATGDLDVVTVGGSGEVGELVEQFNDMVRAVRDRDAALRNQSAALADANADLEAFAYSVSHDLRAPLRAIDGFSKIVIEEYDAELDPEARRLLGRVRGAVQRMGVLIDSLLDLSRVGSATLSPREVDLSLLARQAVADLRSTDPDRSVTVTIEPDLVVEGDPALLQLAVNNLIGNAWKFTSRRESARIDVGPLTEPGGFYVRDNGAGFDMAFAGKLFGAFQRLHDSAQFPGTGIGLATVQRVVRRHQGRVWAVGAVDEGATFHCVLTPLAASAPPDPSPIRDESLVKA